MTVLSTATWDAYPQDLVDHARAVGVQLGGARYLAALARTIIDGAASEEEIARRLIGFVQRSVFRDPVSQPLTHDGDTPDSLTILLCARGRCSHTAALLVELFRHAGIDARARQLTNHVIAEAQVGGRWIIADADAFKNGIIPVNRRGELLAMEDLEADPFQLDRFQPTGWWARPGSRFARGVRGGILTGYVDALDPDERGFVSGYYVPFAKGYPPSLPAITRLQLDDQSLRIEWTASRCAASTFLRYRVAVSTTSRRWSYDDPGDHDQIAQPIPADILAVETSDTQVVLSGSYRHLDRAYASVTAINDRIQLEPETYFWPSEEAACVR